ncbi:MAG TPA: septum site-determining protein MinC [Azospirillaceae bacterium]|nr:septum site-determining protein MinC [Azospirillaceae bacterium]
MTGATNPRAMPFQLRGNTYTMMVLKLVDPYDPGFFQHLQTKIQQAPNFFRYAPVVLDLEEFNDPDFDFPAFQRQLFDLSLVAVGIQGGTPEMQLAALKYGLTVIPAARTPQPMTVARSQPQAAPQPAAAPAPAPEAVQRTTLIVTEPVRSGRQIYASGGDLIVLGPVSPGAELVADGNIHVYNTLRGRALAGVGGDAQARIFVQSLDAEVVSVAGFYRVSDDIDAKLRRKPVQIWLDGNIIRMDPLA